MPARAWRRKGHRHRHVVYAVIELDVDSRAPQVILGDGAQLEAEARKRKPRRTSLASKTFRPGWSGIVRSSRGTLRSRYEGRAHPGRDRSTRRGTHPATEQPACIGAEVSREGDGEAGESSRRSSGSPVLAPGKLARGNGTPAGCPTLMRTRFVGQAECPAARISNAEAREDGFQVERRSRLPNRARVRPDPLGGEPVASARARPAPCDAGRARQPSSSG